MLWKLKKKWCDGKAESQQSLLQSLESHDPSETNVMCWFDVQEYLWKLYFFQCSLQENKVNKKSIYLKCKYFVFADTFDQFYASLLKKYINKKLINIFER